MVKNRKEFRLKIFKSNKHIYANLIDERNNKVMTSSSTISIDTKKETQSSKNCITAGIVGKNIGIKMKQLGIEKIIFDRGGHIYHGQIKALAEGTRKEGIIF